MSYQDHVKRRFVIDCKFLMCILEFTMHQYSGINHVATIVSAARFGMYKFACETSQEKHYATK